MKPSSTSSDGEKSRIEEVKELVCAQCNKEASKKCGKCKKVWYCSRECQTSHWKLHKSVCL
jgi:hypothetical protein